MEESKNKAFKNRVYGCAVVKAINANYNADFSGQPRTLPDGSIYATDKAFKYVVKKYLNDNYPELKIFGLKRCKEDFVPFSLVEAFEAMFTNLKGSNDKKEVAKSLLSCFDVRTFGLTFAGKGKDDNLAISVHGPVQILYGVNLWEKAQKYSDQIMSPFRNPDDKSEDKQSTTLGRQSRLDEGHYLHHFSINPMNLRDITMLAGDGCDNLTDEDIKKLKEAMRCGVTWYDSTSKAGCENEMLVWVQLTENSKIILPNFSTLITLSNEKEEGKCVYDFTELKNMLTGIEDEVEKIEVNYNKWTCKIKNLAFHVDSPENNSEETKLQQKTFAYDL